MASYNNKFRSISFFFYYLLVVTFEYLTTTIPNRREPFLVSRIRHWILGEHLKRDDQTQDIVYTCTLREWERETQIKCFRQISQHFKSIVKCIYVFNWLGISILLCQCFFFIYSFCTAFCSVQGANIYWRVDQIQARCVCTENALENVSII